MAWLFAQYLAIFNNENLPKNLEKIDKVGREVLNKPSKTARLKILPNRSRFKHSGTFSHSHPHMSVPLLECTHIHALNLLTHKYTEAIARFVQWRERN